MKNRIELPRPTSFNDMYMFDQCQSLRAIVDMLTMAQTPPAQTTGDNVVLREAVADADAPVTVEEVETVAPKAKHRDAKRG